VSSSPVVFGDAIDRDLEDPAVVVDHEPAQNTK
jgi:hypothetical protein